MTVEQLNRYIDEVNRIAVAHGWYESKFNDQHYYMLIVTEIAEAIQADRRNKKAQMKSFTAYYNDKSDEAFIFPDDCHNDNDLFVDAYNLYVEDTVDGEIADIIIRVLSFLGMHDLHLKSLPDLNLLQKEYVGTELFFTESTFTEVCYYLTGYITLHLYDSKIDLDIVDKLSYIISFIYKWSKYLSIDLDRQIKLKVRYNSLRNYKHDKKY